jgi:hypothetical protein
LASISGTRSTPSAFSTKRAKLWKSVPSPITASRSGGFHRSMEARLPVSFRVHGPGLATAPWGSRPKPRQAEPA